MSKSTPVDPDGFIKQSDEDLISADDVYFLEAMIEQMNQATDRALKALDDTLSFITESNIRISKLETKK